MDVKSFFGCLATLLALSGCVTSPSRMPSSVEIPTCSSLGGTERGGRCYCGEKEIGVRYDVCENNVPMPQLLTSLIEVPLAGPDSVSKNGYRYRATGNYQVGNFPSQAICKLEISYGRENDGRVMPGGSGDSGSRIGCLAQNGSCPSLDQCLDENESLGQDTKYYFYQIVYAIDHYGTFNSRDELKARIGRQ